MTETVLTPLEKSTGDKHCLTESDHMDETRPSNTTDRQTCYRRTEADAVGPSTKITRDRSYSYGQAVFNTRNSSSLHGGAEEAIGHHRLSLQFGAPQLPVGSRRRKVSTVTELKRTIHTMSKAKPQTLKKMYENFQSYAHVVQLEVDEPFGTERCCCCCHGQLCQTYAVMFSQLQEYAYRIVHRFAVHCITTRSDPQRAELLPMTMAGLIIHHGVIRYVVHRARMMKRLGRPQNEEAINRLLQKVTEIEKQLPEVQSSDPMDSRPSTSISSNASSSNPRQRQEYTAFKFGRRRSDHGLVEEWTHAPCPFAETLFPPLELSWPTQDTKVESTSAGGATVTRPPPPILTDAAKFPFGSEGGDDVHRVLKTAIQRAHEELREEAEWVMGLKESLAAVVAFARIDIMKEMEDPLNVSQT